MVAMYTTVTRPAIERRARALAKSPKESWAFPDAIPSLITNRADCKTLLEKGLDVTREGLDFSMIAALAVRHLAESEVTTEGSSTALTSMIRSRKRLLAMRAVYDLLAHSKAPRPVKELCRAMGTAKDASQVGALAVKDLRRIVHWSDEARPFAGRNARPVNLAEFTGRMGYRHAAIQSIADGQVMPFGQYHAARRNIRQLATLHMVAAVGAPTIDDPLVETAALLMNASNMAGRELGPPQAGPEVVQAPERLQQLMTGYLEGVQAGVIH